MFLKIAEQRCGMLRLLGILLSSVALAAQSQAPATGEQAGQTTRDLTLAGPNKPAPARTDVPRGYALLVGVARYQNLDEIGRAHV